ncbi:hypothetical protein HPB49_020630 [Dermacentor silvarum]|uniref:Uncharacterized protein n=1 Tax=Dermacentor silvarum TaxID=543639 RepID=A0ACB8CTC6_DERSI|nr:hypothetical protein HPB49_020630 [Dermacentor silvarum]
MSEQGRPEQERQARADQPNASEGSPSSADGTYPEYLSSAPTLSIDSCAPKRSRKRSSSKGSSGRSRKRSPRKILGLVSEDVKREDKSARKEDSSKKGLSSTDSAARNASATSLLVRELPPTDLSAKELSAADKTAKDQSAKNLSEKNLPAQSLSAKDISTKASTAVVQDLLGKKTFSKDVLTRAQSTKDLTAKESSAKDGSANDIPAQESSASSGLIQDALRQCLPEKQPLVKDLPVKEGVVNDLLARKNSAKKALARDIMTKDMAANDLAVKESSAKKRSASDPSANDTSAAHISANDMSERAHRDNANDEPGNAASNVPQGQPHVTPEQHQRPAVLSFTSLSTTSPRDLTSPLTAAVGCGSNSSPEDNPLADQLVASVLKGRELPLHPSQLPVSPMLEREPPRRSRRVSLDLRPIVEFISPWHRSSLSESLSHQHPPGQEPSSFAGKLAPTGREESGHRVAEGGLSSDDVAEEKRVQVYRPVLKVRQPAVVEQERPPSVHLDTEQYFDECPLPDTLPGGALSLAVDQLHWSYFDDVDAGLSRDKSPRRRASCIRHPAQPQRRGSRVSLKDVNRSTVRPLFPDVYRNKCYTTRLIRQFVSSIET